MYSTGASFRESSRIPTFARASGRKWAEILGSALGGYETSERQPIIFFVVTLLVSIGAEFTAAGKPPEQRELLAAVKASHVLFIGFLTGTP